jgi:hypothetical protein
MSDWEDKTTDKHADAEEALKDIQGVRNEE